MSWNRAAKAGMEGSRLRWVDSHWRGKQMQPLPPYYASIRTARNKSGDSNALGQGKAAPPTSLRSPKDFVGTLSDRLMLGLCFYLHSSDKKMIYQCNKMRITESVHFKRGNGNKIHRLNGYCKKYEIKSTLAKQFPSFGLNSSLSFQ